MLNNIDKRTKLLAAGVGVLAVLSIGLLIGVIVLATKNHDKVSGSDSEVPAATTTTTDPTSAATTINPPVSSTSSRPPVEDICYSLECLESAASLIRGMNTSVDPCVNFYEFSCGGWMQANPIPNRFSSWGRFNILRDELSNKLVEILSATDDADLPESLQLAKIYYDACVRQDANTGENEAELGTFIDGIVDESPAVPLGKLLALLRRDFGGNYLITSTVSIDEENSQNYAIYVDQPSLGLSRTYLVGDVYIEPYTNLTKNMWELVYPSTVINYAALVEFEQELANITTTEEDRRNRTELYNLRTLQELSELTNFPELDWTDYFTELFTGTGVEIPGILTGTFIVRDLKYFEALGALVTKTDPQVLTNYLKWRLMTNFGNDFSPELRAVLFEFTRITQGTQTPPSKELRCADKSNAFFGMAISYKYVRDVFAGDFEAQMNEMITNIRSTFHTILDGVEWFQEEETRAKAKVKLDKIKPFLGFPSWLINNATEALAAYYSGLKLGTPESDHFRNQGAITGWRLIENLKLISVKRDPDRWNTDPTIVNAFYSSTSNSITFPAGILQPPFYFTPAPIQALNYGAIGMVIGHEITHGFDDRGRQSDGDGNLVDWWDEGTVQNYIDKAQCFVNQYSSYVAEELNGLYPEGPVHLKGQNTLGENVADNGGLRESFLAYKAYLADKGPEAKLPGLDYTPEQLFFLSFSQIWCGSWTNAGLYNQIQTGVHSPNRFRVKGVIDNSVEFAETWNCPAPPATACRIW